MTIITMSNIVVKTTMALVSIWNAIRKARNPKTNPPNKEKPMAAAANNIILIWVSDGGRVHLGFGRFAMKKTVFDASQNG